MEEISTRAVFAGVGIFVTAIIFSILVASFSQIKEIFVTVKERDTSIHGQFDEMYAIYHKETITTMELLNIIKKFEDDPEYGVTLKYTNQDKIIEYMTDKSISVESKALKDNIVNENNGFKYTNTYTGNVTASGNNITINFNKD